MGRGSCFLECAKAGFFLLRFCAHIRVAHSCHAEGNEKTSALALFGILPCRNSQLSLALARVGT
jgi:hypothetical protein